MKKKWFEGSGEINCDIQKLQGSINDHGKFYIGAVGLMPGLTRVELLDQGSDYLTIKTNEGTMKRTNISKRIDPDRVVVEFDEEYQAGRLVTVYSHYLDEFTSAENGVHHRIVISGLKAPGFLGFFYRAFGGTRIGTAALESCKKYLEMLEE